jgi:hypothetical protein
MWQFICTEGCKYLSHLISNFLCSGRKNANCYSSNEKKTFLKCVLLTFEGFFSVVNVAYVSLKIARYRKRPVTITATVSIHNIKGKSDFERANIKFKQK